MQKKPKYSQHEHLLSYSVSCNLRTAGHHFLKLPPTDEQSVQPVISYSCINGDVYGSNKVKDGETLHEICKTKSLTSKERR